MITRLLLVPVVLFLASCIDFTKQTLTFRYDGQEDRLYIFQNYEGIHGTDAAWLTVTEMRELDAAIKGQQTYFFNNWLFTFSRTDTEASVKQLEAKIDKSEESKLDLARNRLLLANVKIRNGAFYMNARNQLSGYQYITVDHFSKLVEAYNRQIAHVVQTRKDTSDLKGFKLSKESQALLRKAAAGGFGLYQDKGQPVDLYFAHDLPGLSQTTNGECGVGASRDRKEDSKREIYSEGAALTCFPLRERRPVFP